MTQSRNQSNTNTLLEAGVDSEGVKDPQQDLEENQEMKAMDRTHYKDWVATLASESDRCKSDYMSADAELQSLVYSSGTKIPNEEFNKVAMLSAKYMAAQSALWDATPTKWEERKLASQAPEVSISCELILHLMC